MYIVIYYNNDEDLVVCFKDGVMYVFGIDGEWYKIRMAFCYFI